jgi:hypothetical protein
MGRGDNPSLYKPVTHIELGVPWVFFGLHGFVLLRTVPWGNCAGGSADGAPWSYPTIVLQVVSYRRGSNVIKRLIPTNGRREAGG